MSEPQWAIAYHSNSSSARAQKWYRVSRLIEADGYLFELYWHPDAALRSNNRDHLRKLAAAAGLDLMPGTYRDKRQPGVVYGSQMERT